MTELLEQAIASVQQLSESEQDGIAAMIFQEIEKKQAMDWDEFDQIIQDSQVSTGISDLSQTPIRRLITHVKPSRKSDVK